MVEQKVWVKKRRTRVEGEVAWVESPDTRSVSDVDQKGLKSKGAQVKSILRVLVQESSQDGGVERGLRCNG